MMFEGNPDRNWKPNEERKSRLIFIGKDLPKDVITRGF